MENAWKRTKVHTCFGGKTSSDNYKDIDVGMTVVFKRILKK
jgi:hypothetical protein